MNRVSGSAWLSDMWGKRRQVGWCIGKCIVELFRGGSGSGTVVWFACEVGKRGRT